MDVLDALGIGRALEVQQSEIQGGKNGKFGLLVAGDSGWKELLPAIVILALRGSVKVLDAGNHFDLIQVAYSIRKFSSDLYAIAERIQIVRAFTCIEVMLGLQQIEEGTPVVVIDLLATFYDDAVSDKRSLLLVNECISQIQRLTYHAPVLISARPNAPEGSPRKMLFPTLLKAADVSQIQQTGIPQAQQRLF